MRWLEVCGSVDILAKGLGYLRRYKLKLSPSKRACRFCMGNVRPGARAESLRFTEEKTLSIKARTPVESSREGSPHLGAHSPDAPGFPSTFGGDDASCSQLLTDIRSDSSRYRTRHRPAPVRCAFCSEAAPTTAGKFAQVVPRTTSRHLCQQKLPIQIDHDHPFQPEPPRQRFLPMVMQAPHEERTDRSLRLTGSSHCHAGSAWACSPRLALSAYSLPDSSIDGLVAQALQETIQRCEVGHASEPQRLMQFAVLAQPYLGFPKGQIFVAHQTQNGQQLRLCELMLVETAAVARRGSVVLAICRATRAKGRRPTSAITPPASIANTNFKEPTTSNCSWLYRGCQQSQGISLYLVSEG